MWCLTSSISKYVWNFEIYYGKENAIPPHPPTPTAPPRVSSPINHDVDSKCEGQYGGSPRTGQMLQVQPRIGDAKLAHNVVLQLVDGLWDVGHCKNYRQLLLQYWIFYSASITRHVCFWYYHGQSGRSSYLFEEHIHIQECTTGNNTLEGA